MRARSAAASCAEQTTPSRPHALRQLRERRSLADDGASGMADLAQVGVVEARQHRHADQQRRSRPVRGRRRVDRIARGRAASPARRSRARSASRRRAAPPPRRHCATVFGMSWNLRSRKTLKPRSTIRRTGSGPAVDEELLADLQRAFAGDRGDRRARAPPSESAKSSATMTRSDSYAVFMMLVL